MAIPYPGFDDLLARWYEPVYRFCFLMTRVPRAAEEAAFQTFLYVGAQTEAPPSPEEERDALLRWAVRTCEDYYYRKGRRRYKRRDLEALAPFPIGNELWHLIALPLRRRAAFFLHHCLGCTAEQTAWILKTSPARAEKLAVPGGPYSVDALKKAAGAVVPDKQWAEALADDVYLRFEERSVAVENRLLSFRSAMDRAIPWIALVILALFAAAAVYTAGLGV